MVIALLLSLMAPGDDEEILARCERVLMRIEGVSAVEWDATAASRRILVTVANDETAKTVKLLTKDKYQGLPVKIVVGKAKPKPKVEGKVAELECDIVREKFGLKRREGARCEETRIKVSKSPSVDPTNTNLNAVEEVKVRHREGCPLEKETRESIEKLALRKQIREAAREEKEGVREPAVKAGEIGPEIKLAPQATLTLAQLNFESYQFYVERGNYYKQYVYLRRVAAQKTDPDLAALAKEEIGKLCADEKAREAISKGIEEDDFKRYMSLGDTYLMNGLLSGCLPFYKMLSDCYPRNPKADEARQKMKSTEARIDKILKELDIKK